MAKILDFTITQEFPWCLSLSLLACERALFLEATMHKTEGLWDLERVTCARAGKSPFASPTFHAMTIGGGSCGGEATTESIELVACHVTLC